MRETMNSAASKDSVSEWGKRRQRMPSLEEIERQDIIYHLNKLGYHDTGDKSLKELSAKLALLQIRAESPHSSWF